MDQALTKKNWFLGGDVTVDAALSVLQASQSKNCFGVYKSSQNKYILSARYQAPDSEGELFDHLVIEKGESGHYRVPGQESSNEDIVKAVEDFVSTFDPPLLPALQGSAFETQISLADDPPAYDEANKVLKPDIAPLPDITSVKVETAKEAKTGRISPSSTHIGVNVAGHGQQNRPTYGTALPQWHRYETLHRCHPKNVCYGCCYRKNVWSGYRYLPKHEWYNCRGSGPLRILGLIIFWLLFFSCFGCYKCTSFFGNLICHIWCGFYDSS